MTNIDLLKYANAIRIPHFRGVYMRNDLPAKVKQYESGIINLDNREGEGTHWVAYKKNNECIEYFDSFGDLRPPVEVERYLLSDDRGKAITYNYDRYQKFTDMNCGQLCLAFLININGK